MDQSLYLTQFNFVCCLFLNLSIAKLFSAGSRQTRKSFDMLPFSYQASACITSHDTKASVSFTQGRKSQVRDFAYTVTLISVVPSSANMWILPADLRIHLRYYLAVSLVFRTISFSTTQDISSVCNELETVKYGMNLETFWFRMFTLKPDARKQLN